MCVAPPLFCSPLLRALVRFWRLPFRLVIVASREEKCEDKLHDAHLIPPAGSGGACLLACPSALCERGALLWR